MVARSNDALGVKLRINKRRYSPYGLLIDVQHFAIWVFWRGLQWSFI